MIHGIRDDFLGGTFSLKYFSFVILRLCIDVQLPINPGISKTVCGGGVGGGGGWVVVECEFNV